MRDQTCARLRTALDGARGTLGKSMNVRRGILIGVVAVAVAWVFWPSQAASPGEMDEGDEVTVLSASRYIPAFTALKADHVVSRSITKTLVPPGALHRVSDLKDSRGRNLFFTAVPIPAGQLINRAVLVETGRSHGLSSLLEPGTAAVAVSVDATHGAGGWVEPGDSIAIFLTSLPTPRHPAPQTRMLFPLIHVLAVNRARLGADAGSARPPEDPDLASTGASEGCTLTLLVNPLQAQALIGAKEEGALTVVLRGLGDDSSWML